MPKKKTQKKRRTSKIATTRRAKKSAGNKPARRAKKTAKKKQSKKTSASSIAPSRKQTAPRSRTQFVESSRAKKGAATDRQSGDLEGLSRVEQADSQSVDELVEEGNVFEAGAVAGVEAADDEDTKEVRTHEVPEDDVPDEYLEKD